MSTGETQVPPSWEYAAVVSRLKLPLRRSWRLVSAVSIDRGQPDYACTSDKMSGGPSTETTWLLLAQDPYSDGNRSDGRQILGDPSMKLASFFRARHDGKSAMSTGSGCALEALWLYLACRCANHHAPCIRRCTRAKSQDNQAAAGSLLIVREVINKPPLQHVQSSNHRPTAVPCMCWLLSGVACFVR